MVSQPLIQELKTILKEDYRKELEESELVKFANDIVEFFNTIKKTYQIKENQLK